MSNGYYQLERPGPYDGHVLASGDRHRLIDLAELGGWNDLDARRELATAGDGVEDDAGNFTDAQAVGLANALERVLDDIPDHDARQAKLVPYFAGMQQWAEDEQNPLTPLEWFSGEDKEFVRSLAAFCRRGAFRIVFEHW